MALQDDAAGRGGQHRICPRYLPDHGAARTDGAGGARYQGGARPLPEADQAERELLDDHNTIRKNEFQNVAGSDVTQGIAIDAAEKNIDSALGAAFRSGGSVDPQAVMGAIQAEQNAPSGKLPPVRAVMKTVADAMQKEDGSGLETDPTQVYGVRRVINYLQSKNAIAENPAYGSPDVQGRSFASSRRLTARSSRPRQASAMR